MTIDEAKIFIQNAMEQSRNALAELMLIMPKVFAVKRKSLGEYYSNLENCKKEIQACEVAVKALEEVQQYRAIGTPEELQRLKDRLVAKKVSLRHVRKFDGFDDAEDMQDVIYALRDYPTTYDLDKVVAQLEEFREEMEQFKCSGMLSDMIEVVKAGGVDAKTDS